MLHRKILYLLSLTFLSFSAACSKDDQAAQINPDPVQNYRPLDLSALSGEQGVMMQAFYWNVEPRGEWWNILAEQVDQWAAAGIDRIWLPPASKGQSGANSMGYDVSDYFDFGDYEQHRTTETRFGSRKELENLIATAHANDLEVIADIVINHNSGGGLQYNPYRNSETYTLFDRAHGNASGMFNRTYEHFHPNKVSQSDSEVFVAFPTTDLDHDVPYVQDWLWEKDSSVAKYYKNELGFDGWRFDYVLGYEPWVVKQWVEEVGGFSVGELWHGNAAVLEDYVEASGSPVFDFSTFYKLEEGLDRYNDLNYLKKHMLWQTHPEKAVTFVANHDTEKDPNQENNISAENKLQAYAFILTHPGYPTIFYSDYENPDFKKELQQLILIHNALAEGVVEILYADQDEYIMQRRGNGENPGLILYLNTSNVKRSRESILTQWKSQPLMDYTSNTEFRPVTGENGKVTLKAPADGYAVYSVMVEE